MQGVYNVSLNYTLDIKFVNGWMEGGAGWWVKDLQGD